MRNSAERRGSAKDTAIVLTRNVKCGIPLGLRSCRGPGEDHPHLQHRDRRPGSRTQLERDWSDFRAKAQEVSEGKPI